jgi:hypothetical protein
MQPFQKCHVFLEQMKVRRSINSQSLSPNEHLLSYYPDMDRIFLLYAYVDVTDVILGGRGHSLLAEPFSASSLRY